MAKDLPGRGLTPPQRIIAAKNPAWFVRHFLGIEPWPTQERVLQAIAKSKRVAASSEEKTGKTFTAALANIWWLMIHETAIVVNTAPTNAFITDSLWPEIKKIHERNEDLIGGRITNSALELGIQRFATGFAVTKRECFPGYHSPNMLVIVDEASHVREFVYGGIIGCLTIANARLLMVGRNERREGPFNDAFYLRHESYNTMHF